MPNSPRSPGRKRRIAVTSDLSKSPPAKRARKATKAAEGEKKKPSKRIAKTNVKATTATTPSPEGDLEDTKPGKNLVE